MKIIENYVLCAVRLHEDSCGNSTSRKSLKHLESRGFRSWGRARGKRSVAELHMVNL